MPIMTAIHYLCAPGALCHHAAHAVPCAAAGAPPHSKQAGVGVGRTLQLLPQCCCARLLHARQRLPRGVVDGAAEAVVALGCCLALGSSSSRVAALNGVWGHRPRGAVAAEVGPAAAAVMNLRVHVLAAATRCCWAHRRPVGPLLQWHRLDSRCRCCCQGLLRRAGAAAAVGVAAAVWGPVAAE